MKRNLPLLIAVYLLTACSAAKILTTGATGDAKPKVGETALVKAQRDGLSEGVVENIEGARYKIKYGTSEFTAEESDVYTLPKAGAKPDVKPGDIVAAKMDTGLYWAAADVLSVKGDVIEVRGIFYGTTANLSPDKIIVVRPAAVAEFQKFKAEKEFTGKAKQARPHAPAGYKPKVGDHVIAEWNGGSWWVGDVTGVTGEKAKIKWESFGESEVTFERIVPYPKAEDATTLPAAGSFVLVKPDGGKGQWNYAQVTTVNTDSAEVKFPDGKTRPIKTGEFIALY